MPTLRIYRPSRNAMQSGRANTKQWVAEFAPADRKEPDPLMGWSGSRDTLTQVKLSFESKEAAIAFADRRGYDYEVWESEPARPPVPKAYSDNFRYDRVDAGSGA